MPIKKFQEVLDTLCIDPQDQKLADEYKKLLNQYKKIVKRSDKIIKMNDKMQLTIMNANDSLVEDKVNILHFSKKKILNNVSSQREIKEQYSVKMAEYIETIKTIKDKAEKCKIDNADNMAHLRTLARKYENNAIRLKNKEKSYDLLSVKFDIFKESQVSFESLLEKEIISVRRNGDNLALGILSIDSFESLRTKIEEFTTEESFLLAITKYLRNSLQKSDTVKYYKNGMFYTIMPYVETKKAIETIKTLSKTRVVNGISIALHGSLAYLTVEDDVASLISNCMTTYRKNKV